MIDRKETDFGASVAYSLRIIPHVSYILTLTADYRDLLSAIPVHNDHMVLTVSK